MRLIRKPSKKPPALVRFTIVPLKGVGPFMIAADDDGICWTGMTNSVARLKKQFPKSILLRDDSLKGFGKEIEGWWTGKRRALSLPLVVYGTPFQHKVWDALMKIKKGDTRTYSEIARMAGRPRAVRAAGSAVGKNPVTLVIPCHRVLAQAANAQLKFGWGPEAKKKLLKAEGVL